MYENILFEKKDGVAYLTLNRPDRLNALNGAVLKELDDALAAIDGDAEIRVLVVRGAGEKALAAGADITEMQSMEAEAGMAFGAFGQKVFAKIEALRQPSIAMIPGFALGGGCELALACDIRIASEKARFGQPEVGLGITAGFGGTQRLPRLVGRGAASLLLFSGNMIDAAEAGTLTLEKLEAMTAVCSVGLDMIVLPGDTPADTISAIIADEAAIGMVNSKTTAVRVIPAIGHEAGEVLDFGGLLGTGPIMKINRKSSSVMIQRGGRIPAPMQSLKN